MINTCSRCHYSVPECVCRRRRLSTMPPAREKTCSRSWKKRALSTKLSWSCGTGNAPREGSADAKPATPTPRTKYAETSWSATCSFCNSKYVLSSYVTRSEQDMIRIWCGVRIGSRTASVEARNGTPSDAFYAYILHELGFRSLRVLQQFGFVSDARFAYSFGYLGIVMKSIPDVYFLVQTLSTVCVGFNFFCFSVSHVEILLKCF